MTRREDRLFQRYVQRGHPQDLAKVFDLTAAELLKVALHVTRDPHRAEDAVQTTFLVALEKARHWDPSRPVLPWLLGILGNRIREQRRADRQTPDQERLTKDAAPDPAVLAEWRELTEAAGDALRNLREPYRQVLILHLQHGLSAKELAEALDRPAGTVRAQISRGLDLLRSALPAGAISGAIVLGSGRGLPAIRQVVLEQASLATGVAATGAAPTLMRGWLQMTNAWMVAVTGMLLGLLGWMQGWWWDGAELGSTLPAGEAAPTAAELPAPVAKSERTATQTTAVATATPPTTGDLRARLRYADGAPAVGLVVTFPGHAPGITNAKGEFVFRGIAAAERVRVQIPECSGNLWSRVTAGTETIGTLTVRRGLRVHGIVVSQAGAPVAGAEVATLGNFEFHQAITRTDAMGTFTIANLSTHQDLIARADGHTVSKAIHPTGKSGATVQVRLQLSGTATTLRGVVRDPSGQPAVGAEVAVLNIGAFHVPPPIFVTTSKAGTFETRRIASGPHLVCARLVQGDTPWLGLLETHIPASGRDGLSLPLSRGGTLSGVLSEATGAPKRSTQIVLRYRHDKVHNLPFTRRFVYTDNDGRYRISGLLAGNYKVEAGDRGNRLEQPLQIRDGGRHEWSPSLAAQMPLKMIVLGPGGSPQIDWRVELLNESGFSSRGFITNAEGEVAFPRLKGDGEYHFTIHQPIGDDPVDGFKEYAHLCNLRVGPLRPDQGPHTVRVRADQMSTSGLKGRVVDDRGAGLRAKLSIYHRGDNRSWVQLLTDGDGKFTTQPLAAGTFDIYVSAEGFPRRALSARRTTAGQVLDLGAIAMAAPGQLTVDVRGAGASGARVRLRRGGWTRGVGRNRDGTYRAETLAPGTYTLQVTGPRTAPFSRSITIASGPNSAQCDVQTAATQKLELQLPPGRPDPAHWSHTLTVKRGDRIVLVDNVTVRLQTPSEHRFVQELGLPDGTYTVSIVGWEKSRAQATIQLGPRRTTTKLSLVSK